MEYKIKIILHSGSKGIIRGIDRTDGRYPMRIGRIVDLELKNITVGEPLYLKYVKDSDGSDYHGVLCISRVVNFDCTYDKSSNWIKIETLNSIFILKALFLEN